jgi:hypothetical protein
VNDKELLLQLLEAEYELEVVGLLTQRGLFEEANSKRWVALGNMPNNQSIVHAQQSSPAAALVENSQTDLTLSCFATARHKGSIRAASPLPAA